MTGGKGSTADIDSAPVNERYRPILLKNSIAAFLATVLGVSNHHLRSLRRTERVLEGRFFRDTRLLHRERVFQQNKPIPVSWAPRRIFAETGHPRQDYVRGDGAALIGLPRNLAVKTVSSSPNVVDGGQYAKFATGRIIK